MNIHEARRQVLKDSEAPGTVIRASLILFEEMDWKTGTKVWVDEQYYNGWTKIMFQQYNIKYKHFTAALSYLVESGIIDFHTDDTGAWVVALN
jgi:hypothetical protein